MADRKAFSSAMALLSETFNKTMSKTLLDAFWSVLGELTDAELGVATARALRECKFFPAPAEMLTLAGIVLPTREERERENRRRAAQAELDADVRDTYRRLDALFGRAPSRPALEADPIRALAEAKSNG